MMRNYNDKTVTNETADARTKKNCNRENVLERSVEKLLLGEGGLTSFTRTKPSPLSAKQNCSRRHFFLYLLFFFFCFFFFF